MARSTKPSWIERCACRLRRHALKLGSLLTTLGIVSARDVAMAIAEQGGVRYVETSAFPEIPILEERISARFLRDARALPLEEDEESLTIAVADPFDDLSGIRSS